MASEEKYVHGIDLGTTYSCISYIDENGQVNCCKDSKTNMNTVPSVVYYSESGDIVVGNKAKDRSLTNPNNVISFVKRKIGRESFVTYGENLDKEVSPVEVSAEILKKMAQNASDQEEGAAIKNVTITVPAYFDNTERTLTEEAGKLAGFENIDIIEEPVAAAIYYGVKDERDETVLVYDLGGGTFDITAVEIKKNVYNVLTKDGRRELGGADWDNEMIKIIKSKFQEETGHGDEYDAYAESSISKQAEDAKKELTEMSDTSAMINADGELAAIEITRDEFESATKYLIDQTIELTKDVYNRTVNGELHDGQKREISKILLVGGSSRMCQVTKELEAAFPGIPLIINDPDEAVSKGAAIFAFNKLKIRIDKSNTGEDNPIDDNGNNRTKTGGGNGGDKPKFEVPGGYGDSESGTSILTVPGLGTNIKINTVTSKSLGLQVRIGTDEKGNDILAIKNVIKKDTPIPHTCTVDNLILPVDNMPRFQLDLCQNDSFEEAIPYDEKLSIGSTMVEMHTPNKKYDKVLIVIDISEDGMIHAKGKGPSELDEFEELEIKDRLELRKEEQ